MFYIITDTFALTTLFSIFAYYALIYIGRRRVGGERYYLCFAFFSLATAGYLSLNSPVTRILLTEQGYKSLRFFLAPLQSFFLLLMVFFLIQFLTRFLRISKKGKRPFLVNYTLSLLVLLISFAAPLYKNNRWYLEDLMPVLIVIYAINFILLCLFCAHWIIRYKLYRHHNVRIILIGLLMAIICILINYIIVYYKGRSYGVLGHNYFKTNNLLVGLAMFLFGYAIAYSFNSEYHELVVLKNSLEDQVRQRTDDLARANERLTEMDRIKTNFFANVSHELRTPLTLLLGPLDALVAGRSGKSISHDDKTLLMMRDNGTRLLELINDLLDFTKLESGLLELHRSLFNLVPELERHAAMFRSSANIKGIDFAFTYDEAAGIDRYTVYQDRKLLEKSVFNLLSNALKFTPQGGQIVLQIGVRDGAPVIAVKDSGIGIPGDKLEYIFERFSQLDNAATRRFEGTGIGLALTREMIQLMGGAVEVSSTPGKGSVFSILLPHSEIPAEMSEAPETDTGSSATMIALPVSDAHPEELRPSVAAGNGAVTILVVDDNADMRRYIESILAPDYAVMTAVNGFDALQKIDRVRPDLVISDIMMPEMDGQELTREIKSKPELSGVPVLLLTARADLDTKLDSFESGADDYIIKPFNDSELRARVTAALEMKRLRDDLARKADDLAQALEEKSSLLASLEGSERYLRDLAVTLPVGLVETDRSGKIVFTNRHYRTLLSSVGKSDSPGFGDLLDDDGRRRFDLTCRRILSGDSPLETEDFVLLSGEESQPVIVRSVPIHTGGTVSGIRSVIYEVAQALQILTSPGESFCGAYGISSREKEVIVLLLEGQSYAGIAEKLFISEKTVENHIASIYRKTGVNSRHQLFHAVQHSCQPV